MLNNKLNWKPNWRHSKYYDSTHNFGLTRLEFFPNIDGKIIAQLFL